MILKQSLHWLTWRLFAHCYDFTRLWQHSKCEPRLLHTVFKNTSYPSKGLFPLLMASPGCQFKVIGQLWWQLIFVEHFPPFWNSIVIVNRQLTWYQAYTKPYKKKKKVRRNKRYFLLWKYSYFVETELLKQCELDAWTTRTKLAVCSMTKKKIFFVLRNFEVSFLL